MSVTEDQYAKMDLLELIEMNDRLNNDMCALVAHNRILERIIQFNVEVDEYCKARLALLHGGSSLLKLWALDLATRRNKI